MSRSTTAALAVVVLAGIGLIAAIGLRRGGGPTTPPPPPPSAFAGPLGDVDQLAATDPAAAAARCAELLGDPAGAGDGASLPAFARHLIGRLASEGHFAAADEVVRALIAAFPDAPETDWIRREWRELRLRWATEAVLAGELDESERLFAEILADEPPSAGYQYLERYREHLLARWRAERTLETPDAEVAMAYLVEAAAVHTAPDAPSPVLNEILRRELTETLIDQMADDLIANGLTASALGFLYAVREARALATEAGGDPPEPAVTARLVDRIEACQLDVGRAAVAGRLRTVSWREAGAFLEHVAGAKDPVRRAEATALLVDVALEEGRRLAGERRFEDADAALRAAIGPRAAAAWIAGIEVQGGDPWASLSEDDRARLEASAPNAAGPAERLEALAAAASDGRISPPAGSRRAVARHVALELSVDWAEQLLARGETARGMTLLWAVERGSDAASTHRARAAEAAARAADLVRLDPAAEETWLALLAFRVLRDRDAGADALDATLRSDLLAIAATRDQRRALLCASLVAVVAGDGSRKPPEVAPEVVALAEELAAGGASLEAAGEPEPAALDGLAAVTLVNAASEPLVVVLHGGRTTTLVVVAPFERGVAVLPPGTYRATAVAVREGFEQTGSIELPADASRTVRLGVGAEAASPIIGDADALLARGPYTLIAAPEGAAIELDPATGRIGE